MLSSSSAASRAWPPSAWSAFRNKRRLREPRATFWLNRALSVFAVSWSRNTVSATSGSFGSSPKKIAPLSGRRQDLVGLSMEVNAAGERAAKVQDREVHERAAALVVSDLFQNISFQYDGLIQIPRHAAHRLKDGEVRPVHARRAVGC